MIKDTKESNIEELNEIIKESARIGGVSYNPIITPMNRREYAKFIVPIIEKSNLVLSIALLEQLYKIYLDAYNAIMDNNSGF